MGRQSSATRRAAGTKSARQQEYTTDLPETLELVVSYSNDAQLLCKCSTVSSYFQALAPRARSAAEPVRWLCSTAGREAAGQEAVAQSLLSPGMVVTRVYRTPPAEEIFSCISKDERHVAASAYSRAWAWEPVQKVLASRGLRLSDDLVATAARQHLPSLRRLVEDLMVQVRGSFKPKAHTGLSAAQAYVILDDGDSVSKALKAVALDTMRNLLFIAANEGNRYAWRALKAYDDQHSHLLAIGSTTPPGRSPVTSQTRARRARSLADASTSAAASSKGQAPGEPQGQQGAELMEQLLLTSLLSDDDCEAQWGLRSSADRFLLFDLASQEVAKGLDTSTVLKLMLVAAMRGDGTASQPIGHGPGALTCLSKMPAAKYITADEIVSIIKTVLHSNSCWTDLEGILGLPEARKMTSSQVCQLILMSVQTENDNVARFLATLGRRFRLQRDDVMHLLTTTLPELEADKFLTLLETLEEIQPHRCLTAEDVMQLLPQVARYRGCFREHDIVTQAVKLGFAHKKVQTAERYADFLQSILKASWYEEPDGVIEPLLELHNRPDLRQQDVLQLLRFCIAQSIFVGAFVDLPAAAGLGVAEVWDLVQLCFEKHPRPHYDDFSSDEEVEELDLALRLDMLELVAALPAARRLTSDQVLQLLQQALQAPSEIDRGMLSSVLMLPAAQHISPAGAEGLVQAALSMAASKSWVLEDLCSKIPACAAAFEAVSSSQLQQQLQAVLAEHKSCGVSVTTLLQHPKLQHHIEEVLPTVLLAAFHTRSNRPARSRWCLPPDGEGYEGMKLTLSNQELQQRLRLPAARGLSSKVIAELMGLSVERMGGELLQELVRLPAAAEVVDEVVRGLLQQAAGHASTASPDHGLTDASIAATAGTAAQQQQQAASWSELVLECLAARNGPAVLFPLLQLPWAQLLSASTVRVLLQEAMERQARPAFDRLMQLPQAPLGAADMQLYADALQAPARDGREELFSKKRNYSEESEDGKSGHDGSDSSEEEEDDSDNSDDDASEQGSDGGYSY